LIMTIPAICTEITTASSAAIGYSVDTPTNQNLIHPIATPANVNSIHPLISSADLNKNPIYLSSCKSQFISQALKRNFLGMIRVGLFCPSTAYSY
jgi:hypothetical protein